jgi:hypothetical protein
VTETEFDLNLEFRFFLRHSIPSGISLIPDFVLMTAALEGGKVTDKETILHICRGFSATSADSYAARFTFLLDSQFEKSLPRIKNLRPI